MCHFGPFWRKTKGEYRGLERKPSQSGHVAGVAPKTGRFPYFSHFSLVLSQIPIFSKYLSIFVFFVVILL
jgi:hypothetical protein